MTNSSLAMDYARIFFEVCEEQNRKDEVLYQTKELQKINNTGVKEILDLPIIIVEKKVELLNELKGLEIDPLILNLIKILVTQKQFHLFPEIMNEYQNIYQEKENILIVNVTTASSISNSNYDTLVTKLEKKLDKMVVLLTHEDSSLIGGIKIEFESKEIDNTIKKHLREFISQI